MKSSGNHLENVEPSSSNSDVLAWLQKSADNMSRMEVDADYRDQVKKFTFDDVTPITKINTDKTTVDK